GASLLRALRCAGKGTDRIGGAVRGIAYGFFFFFCFGSISEIFFLFLFCAVIIALWSCGADGDSCYFLLPFVFKFIFTRRSAPAALCSWKRLSLGSRHESVK
ncbi:GDP-mannose 4,6 dehydratase, partial [Trypanosoma cruzi]